MKTKVAIIGSVGIPANYGGFETLVEYLTKELKDKLDITVFCSSKEYDEKLTQHNGAKLRYVNFKANGIQSIPYDIISLLKISRDTKVVLILGVASGFFIPFYKLFSKKKIVVNIDGMEWKREKWGKFTKWFLRSSEKRMVKYADVVIADNKVIADHVKSAYNKDAVVIPYGADHVNIVEKKDSDYAEFSFLNDHYAFKVCRIEPENNLEIILKAFSEIKYTICIVGNWKSSQFGKDLLQKYKEFKNVVMLDPIYDQTKLNLLRSNATVYIHGHKAGGTNPSLVEAMYLGLPIIAFDVNYNRETTSQKALGYFSDSDQLKKLVINLDNDSLKQNSIDMKNVANKRYLWSIIGESYLRELIR